MPVPHGPKRGVESVWKREVADAINALTSLVTSARLRLTATDDVTLSSTDHAFQVGPDNGFNIAMDGNEMQARNNGAGSNLVLNNDGGTLSYNSGTSLHRWGETWTTLTALTGWTAGTGGETPQYRREGNRTFYRGRFINNSGGNLNNANPMCNLPAGFRVPFTKVIGYSLLPGQTTHTIVQEAGGNLRVSAGVTVSNTHGVLLDSVHHENA